MKNWTILEIPDTNDITAIQLKGPYGKVSIFNIYNDCTHSRNETILNRFIQKHANTIIGSENHYMIWASDFNRHHPLWDDDKDTHCTENLLNMITQCEVTPLLCPTATDHFPITTKISLPQERTNTLPSHNFREAGWTIVRKKLQVKISALPNPTTINNKHQLNTAVNHLTTALQKTIQESI